MIFGFLYLPIAVVILYSFNTERLYTWPPRGFTLSWFRRLASNDAILTSLQNSLRVAAVATLLATAIGTLGALALNRSDFRGKRAVQALALMPLLVPGLVTGLGLLLLFTRLKVPLSLTTVIAGHVAFITPIVLFVVTSRLERLGPRLEWAARDLGATPARAFLHVTLPLIASAVVGGALLAFTISFDEVIITFLLTGVDNTLPVQIYSEVRLGVSPQINAVYSLVLVASVLLVAISTRFTRRR